MSDTQPVNKDNSIILTREEYSALLKHQAAAESAQEKINTLESKLAGLNDSIAKLTAEKDTLIAQVSDYDAYFGQKIEEIKSSAKDSALTLFETVSKSASNNFNAFQAVEAASNAIKQSQGDGIKPPGDLPAPPANQPDKEGKANSADIWSLITANARKSIGTPVQDESQ